jgi:thiol-disulfide isomerase/thioredoxin
VIGAGLALRPRNQRLWLIGGSSLLLVASLAYCGEYIPKRMEAVASHVRDYAVPAVTFQPVGEQRAPLHPTPGKILIIDFAQTWCLPCLAELPQIAGVRDDLKDRKDIEFVLVATDAGGDTPTRFSGICRAAAHGPADCVRL